MGDGEGDYILVCILLCQVQSSSMINYNVKHNNCRLIVDVAHTYRTYVTITSCRAQIKFDASLKSNRSTKVVSRHISSVSSVCDVYIIHNISTS